MTDPVRMRMLTFAVVVSVLVIVCAVAGTILYVKSTENKRRENQIASCERGNSTRMRVNVIGSRLELGLPPLAIQDCPVVIK